MKNKILVMSLLFVLSFTTIAYGNDYIFGSEESINTNVSGGAIRIDPKGIYIIADAAHHPIGIKDAYINKKNGALVIVKDNSDPVVTTTVDPDETLTGKGVTVGLSGGGGISQLLFYQNGKRLKLNSPRDYKKIASKYANVWFMSISHNK